MLPRKAALTCRPPRFDRVAITSVFGNPRDTRTWSAAPANVAVALERLGVKVECIAPHIGKLTKARIGITDLLSGRGRPLSGEQLLRNIGVRRQYAAQVSDSATRLGVEHVLHTGTFDLLPEIDAGRGIKHYLYCDHTWDLAKKHHVHAARYSARAQRAFEEAERLSLTGVTHVFTFGRYVRNNLVSHYGLSPERVTAVGSGMGEITPSAEAKNYSRPSLLFVAKHLFQAKGGLLLLQAFELARRSREDLTLTIVGDERSRSFIPPTRGVEFCAHLPWAELQALYRQATLLVQPMLNDPWGQVYLEAMASRTPVMGLARNGLPELVDDGRHGFLVDHASPSALAQAILCALSEPKRLERMATAAQRYVLGTHSWDRVAERIVFS